MAAFYSALPRNSPFHKCPIIDAGPRPHFHIVGARHVASNAERINGDFVMTNKTKITLAAALIAAFATPALAQDEWIVDSGRYLNGEVPSYNTVKAPAYATGAPRLIEGRNAAVVSNHESTNIAPIVPDRATVLGN
jgi:hypothetical protein